MRFHDPGLLLLIPALLVPALMILKRERRRPAFPFAGGAPLEQLPDSPRSRIARLLPYLRILVLVLAVVALARPQLAERESKATSRGRDLMLVLDLSTSMLAEEPAARLPRENRLTMAKAVLRDFLKGRSGDRIGLIAFAARPYPAAPLTLDHRWLQEAVDRLETGAIEDGTALGDALLSALNRLRDKPAQSRAVILITDGRNNAGSATPALASAAAKALGIRVHAIGIGSRGRTVIPVASPLGGTLYRQVDAELDEATLRTIAGATGGGYFCADDRDMLAQVFREIDRLERTSAEARVFFSYRELYPPVLLAALALLMAELTLRQTWLRRLP